MAAPLNGRLERAALLGVAAACFLAGLVCAFWVARVTEPEAIFPKYLEAAALSGEELGERAGDFSPLYLALTRALGTDWRTMLRVQAVLHGATAGAVALAVAGLVGLAWGAAAGLLAAVYRPFLVHAGLHEPETGIVFCLAVAVACAVWARRGNRASPALAVASGMALGAAGLLRPQHLALVPVWALWVALPRLDDDGVEHARQRFAQAAVAVLLGSLVLLGPFSVARWRGAGSFAVMDPGAVLYEGNGPGATGLRSHAPRAVLALEAAHRGESDYRHVAYRRIAAFATAGRGGAPAEANRYWARLALEGMAEWPREAAARLGRKALLAIAPYEAHDLVVAEQLDRRVRRRLPVGFAVLLAAALWVLLVRRERLGELAGPLAVGALALGVQVVFFASARQRLPLALALLVAGTVAAADLVRDRLRADVRRWFAFALGPAVAAGLAVIAGPWALSDQMAWDEVLGRRADSAGERLTAWQEVRVGREELARDWFLFRAGLERLRGGDAHTAVAAFAGLAERGRDFTTDEEPLGVPQYWLARALLLRGDAALARDVLAVAAVDHADEPRIRALAALLETPAGGAAPAVRLRGEDPVSARLLLAEAALVVGRQRLAQELAAPLAADFPELWVAPEARR